MSFHSNPVLSEYLSSYHTGRAIDWLKRLGIPPQNESAHPKFVDPVVRKMHRASKEVTNSLSNRYGSSTDLRLAVGDPDFLNDISQPLWEEYASQIWGSPAQEGHYRRAVNELDCTKPDDEEWIKICLCCYILHRADRQLRDKPSSTGSAKSRLTRKRRPRMGGSLRGQSFSSRRKAPLEQATSSKPSRKPDRRVSSAFSQRGRIGRPATRVPDSVIPQSPTENAEYYSHPSLSNENAAMNTESDFNEVTTGDEEESTYDEDNIKVSKRQENGKLPRVQVGWNEREGIRGSSRRDVYSVPRSPSTMDIDPRTAGTDGQDHTHFRFTPFLQDEDRVSEAGEKSASCVTYRKSVPLLSPTSTTGIPRGATISLQSHPYTQGEEAGEDQLMDQSAGSINQSVAPTESAELRDTLTTELLSCLDPASRENADYENLINVLDLLWAADKYALVDGFCNSFTSSQEAMDVWRGVVHCFYKFRRTTGFTGKRDEWIAFTAALPISERFAALKCFAETQRFMRKLRTAHFGLDPHRLSVDVALMLFKMAGTPDWIPLGHLESYLTAFNEDLFLWLGEVFPSGNP